MEKLVEQLDWSTAIRVWQKFTDFKSQVSHLPNNSNSSGYNDI